MNNIVTSTFARMPMQLGSALFCCSIALTTSSFAADSAAKPKSDTPQDYSHSMLLDLAGKSGVMAVRLPQALYMHARSADLADIRLFDSEGKKVAFALHQPTLADKHETFALTSKIFPLLGNSEANASNSIGAEFELDITRNAQGVLTTAKIRSKGKTSAQNELRALLLDFGLQNKAELPLIDHLQLQIPNDRKDYSAQVWLAVSDDLQHWETIGAADLRWISNAQNEKLVQDQIQFAARRFRYARLSWESGDPVQFASITAHGDKQQRAEPTLESMVITPAKGKFPQDLQYEAAIALPIERLSLNFSSKNVVLPAQIGSYRELPSVKAGQAPSVQFLPITSSVFYQITQQEQLRRPADLSLAPSHVGTWVVRAQDGNPIPSDKQPELKISWQAASMIFLSSGKGPYQLAFGRDKVDNAATELALVAPNFSIAELDKLELAKASPVQINPHFTGTSENSTAELGKSAQNRSYLLWGVLLAGVAVMGVLVLRLMKQMQQEGSKQPTDNEQA